MLSLLVDPFLLHLQLFLKLLVDGLDELLSLVFADNRT
jgi:hypothetical protein